MDWLFWGHQLRYKVGRGPNVCWCLCFNPPLELEAVGFQSVALLYASDCFPLRDWVAEKCFLWSPPPYPPTWCRSLCLPASQAASAGRTGLRWQWTTTRGTLRSAGTPMRTWPLMGMVGTQPPSLYNLPQMRVMNLPSERLMTQFLWPATPDSISLISLGNATDISVRDSGNLPDFSLKNENRPILLSITSYLFIALYGTSWHSMLVVFLTLHLHPCVCSRTQCQSLEDSDQCPTHWTPQLSLNCQSQQTHSFRMWKLLYSFTHNSGI